MLRKGIEGVCDFSQQVCCKSKILVSTSYTNSVILKLKILQNNDNMEKNSSTFIAPKQHCTRDTLFVDNPPLLPSMDIFVKTRVINLHICFLK